MQPKLAMGTMVGLVMGATVACGPGDAVGVSADAQDDLGSDARPTDNEFADAAPPCVANVVAAEQVTLPVDIIWAVDTSRSMAYETAMVESNLNTFAAQIDSWGIDYRVMMVAERGTGDDQVCVPPPLGGADCGDGPRFLHVPHAVASHDALERLLAAYPSYQAFLREESLKHFVVVSDDEASIFADDLWFRATIATLGAPGFAARPASPEGYVFHSIVAWGDVPAISCATGAGIGQSYLDLTALTSGVQAKVCETDWNPIFAALRSAVVEGSQLPCVFALPEPPPGESIDVDAVNVVFTPSGGVATTIARVDSASECGAELGWYYDDPAAPAQIIVCPATCALFTSADGEVDLSFGCTTVVL